MSHQSDSAPAVERSAAKSARASRTNNPLVRGWRSAWAWLTSMRTALILLLMLAVAAVPGSLVPQRSSDPNGVTTWFNDKPEIAPLLDKLQLFNVYTSWWFSAIYVLLFVSLVGCIVPRLVHHWKALRSAPPRTPARLSRLDAYATVRLDERWAGREAEIVAAAKEVLGRRRYRVADYESRGTVSVSAERGYLRETGNLLFHGGMLGLIVSVGLLSGFNWHGQRVLVEGQTFVNGLVSYSSFSPDRFFNPDQLKPFSLRLEKLDVTYETQDQEHLGLPLDYDAQVTVQLPGEEPSKHNVKVNSPLRIDGNDIYLLANGYAPTITVRNPTGEVVFRDSIVFIPQDQFLTSTGVVKVPDGLSEQVGMLGFFYPSAHELESGAFASDHQDLRNPLLTLNVYTGDLGLDTGMPVSVYSLDTENLTPIAARDLDVKPLQLHPGETVELPNGLGTITMDAEIHRYASFDVHSDHTRIPGGIFVALSILGLIGSLLVPRRRVWVAAREHEGGVLVEYAGLARGEDHQLARAVNSLVDEHTAVLVSWKADSRRDPQ